MDNDSICDEVMVEMEPNASQDKAQFESNLAPETQQRPQKRRVEDIEENDEWTQVVNRKQKHRDIRGISEICVTSKEVIPKQFALAKLFREEKLQNITRVRYVNPYKVIIEFDNADSADSMIKCGRLKEMGWRFQRPFEVALSYGVIKNIDLDLSEEELSKCLSCPIEIVNAKRLNRRDQEGTGWSESETWRIGFSGSSLPPYVYIYDMRVAVEPFVFSVTQCSRCWRYGHTLKMCPSKRVFCVKCGGKHENCETEPTSYKCLNCTGGHMALDRACPTFMKERKIRDIMSQFNITYRKAQDMYVPPPVPEYEAPATQSTAPATMTSPELQSTTSRLTYAECLSRHVPTTATTSRLLYYQCRCF